MALTEYQRGIIALLSPRLSRDLDLFHDTKEALLSTWEEDRRILSEGGYRVDARLQYPAFVEAFVRRDTDAVVVQWAVDSAFRFFPLVQGPGDLPALHPFDLATNKALALIGRLEPRDWVDLIWCHDRIQPLGLLAWAACGKDPGTNPTMILSEAGRSGRYAQAELDALSFDGNPPDVAALPPQEVGTCVLDANGRLYKGDRGSLSDALGRGGLRFHRGSIRGSIPKFIDR